MTLNLKKRIYTSTALLMLMFISFINNYVLGYVLIISGVFSILEFDNISKSIFKKNKIKKYTSNLLFIVYIFFIFTFILIFSHSLYLKTLIFAILTTCIMSDIGGFVFGKILKGPKLTKISPKKTFSGAIGSIIFSSLFISLLIYYFTKNFEFKTLFVGVLISITCQIGDLFFSFLKRKSFLIDTGNILPGHGGVLDRIDGILLGLPVGLLIILNIY